MNREFKVGDRIKVYSTNGYKIGKVTSTHFSKEESGFLWFKGELDEIEYPAHPKQCRRLVPKKRREIWLLMIPGMMPYVFSTKEECHEQQEQHGRSGSIARFVEAK